ncbi:MAG TPA: hypothetical protein VMU44_11195 [Steroidobacteraceae bacterium]|nr:hypothetical protein [Steroidobacteraceae bacterium]
MALALALAGTALAHDGEDTTMVTGSITVSPGEHRGDLKTVNGSIRVGRGAAVANAHTVNGSITLESQATAAEAKTVNGSVQLEDGARVSGRIVTVNGSLALGRGAEVTEGLTNVNGAIRVGAAHVGGDITTVNGGMDIGPDAHVDGGILVRKSHHADDSDSQEPPRIVIGPGSVVKGTLKFERAVKLYVSDRATIGPVEGATPIKFSGDRPPE